MLLSYEQLIELARELRSTPVLSVYIDGAAPDPAHRAMWRTQLRHQLDDARDSAESQPHQSREAFDRSVHHLLTALEQIPSAIGARGWVGFVTAAGVRACGPVPTPMPTLAKWQVGAWVSPYVRALKQTYPLVIAMADGRSVDLYQFRAGVLTPIERLEATHVGGHADHMGDAPREHFHGGTRGDTATDATEHSRLASRDRMLRDTSRYLQRLLKDDVAAIIGGVPEAAQALHRAIPSAFASRVLVSHDLPFGSSEAEIIRAADRDARILRNTRDTATVELVLSLAASHGRGVTGAKQTLAVMATGEGQELLITPKFLTEHPGEAEAAVDFALDHDAGVEVLSGEPADLLDSKDGGIAALLRFVREPAIA